MTSARDEELKKRLSDLGESLKQKRNKASKHNESHGEKSNKSFAEGLKLASEFVAGIIVGVVIGLAVDGLAGTWPWGLIVFMILGFCAGTLNLLRAQGVIAYPSMERSSKDEK